MTAAPGSDSEESATVAPPFLAGAMQSARDAAYRGGATVAPPFLAGAMQRAKDAAYRGGATVAPPFLAGAMPGNRRRQECRRHEGPSARDSAPGL